MVFNGVDFSGLNQHTFSHLVRYLTTLAVTQLLEHFIIISLSNMDILLVLHFTAVAFVNDDSVSTEQTFTTIISSNQHTVNMK